MLSVRAFAAIISLVLVNLELVTCRSPGDSSKGPAQAQESNEPVSLPGVDTDGFTAREKTDWSTYVSELLAPCADQPVSVAECIREKRDCKLCLPAAQFLARQVKEGKVRTQVEAAFRKRFAPSQVKKIEAGDSPSVGPVDAPVQIIEWADFECPFCGKAAPMLHELMAEYPGQIRLVFKHYPLSIHKTADKLARVAVAAGAQGKFWEMHARLFTAQAPEKEVDDATIKHIAQQIGLNTKKFQADSESEATADVVARDRKQADGLEIAGTPWIYINGRHFDLSHFDLTRDLDEWIRLEIEAKTGKAPVPVKHPAGDAGAVAPGSSARRGSAAAPTPSSSARSAE